MNVDLTGPRATVEATMTDLCTITFDAGGVHDDILDPVTLRLSRPTNDATTLYAGKCSVFPEDRVNQPIVEGGDQRALLRFVVAIPVTASTVVPGALVHIDRADDPVLVGALLRVASVEQRTIAVLRKLHCELRERIKDRP